MKTSAINAYTPICPKRANDFSTCSTCREDIMLAFKGIDADVSGLGVSLDSLINFAVTVYDSLESFDVREWTNSPFNQATHSYLSSIMDVLEQSSSYQDFVNVYFPKEGEHLLFSEIVFDVIKSILMGLSIILGFFIMVYLDEKWLKKERILPTTHKSSNGAFSSVCVYSHGKQP